jgi:hypothetical protein
MASDLIGVEIRLMLRAAQIHQFGFSAYQQPNSKLPLPSWTYYRVDDYR